MEDIPGIINYIDKFKKSKSNVNVLQWAQEDPTHDERQKRVLED